MRVPMMLLANAAEVQNELLNVAGGGWENYSCPTFPWAVRGALCGMAEVDSDERGDSQVLSFLVSDHEGHELGFRASIVVSPTRGDGPIRTPFVVAFSFVVTEPLLAVFTVHGRDDVELASFSLPVRSLPTNTD